MTDKDLLRFASKAANVGLIYNEGQGRWHLPMLLCDDLPTYWDPLTDDGDAFRLAVALNLDIFQDSVSHMRNTVEVVANDNINPDYDDYFSTMEVRSPDPLAATRRAIVKTAAQIGKILP